MARPLEGFDVSQVEKTTERIRFLREAGVIPRCQTFGSPDLQQTVGLHSWNATNLLLVLHPEPSLSLIKAVMWHDAPERYLGDTPSPAKWASAELRNALVKLEDRIHAHFGTDVDLTKQDLLWLQCVDRLELLLMAQERRSLGDYRFLQMVTTAAAWFTHREIPAQIARFLQSYLHGTRLLDTLPGEPTT